MIALSRRSTWRPAMTSKIAEIRQAMEISRDLAKAQILFVPVPVLNEVDHKRMKAMLALRVMQIAKAASPLAPEGGKDDRKSDHQTI
ncbi:MAG: protein of unknown function DUF1382 [Caudoviricetes sp.]|nr:MAG: protein of unknown function DUF1382 [Caudoviricetes sp.]